MFTKKCTAKRIKGLGNRRVILVDLENVIGGAAMTEGEAQWGKDILESLLDIADDEQVIIGSCIDGAFHATYVWNGARVVTGGGPDAADLALIDVMDHENLASRFTEILLISGDHIFADSVSSLVSQGVPVTVAAWSTGLSPVLDSAATDTILLDVLLSNRFVKAA